ncbi:MAG TPA: MerR family transcriptional regulator [Thermoanaerobaculia bacterium]|nr:MerR family transcriptional regulator [Thermoanaerobaculia bacterium]
MSETTRGSRNAGKKYVMISVVAERLQIHPQTIRLYEREGLIVPTRSAGNTRLYDEEAIRRLETILTLTRDMGVNLAGVEVILNLKDQLEELRSVVDRLSEELRQFSNDERAGIDRRFALVQVKSGLPARR